MTQLVLAGIVLICSAESEIGADETVIFYLTAATMDADRRQWTLPIHGSVFEGERTSWKRRAMLATTRRALGIESGSAEALLFDERMRLFLVDHEHGQRVSIRLGKDIHEVGMSEENGHFYGSVRLPIREAADLARDGWVTFEAVLNDGDERRLAGRVQLIEPQGLSVISDIDDTVRVSRVGDLKAMMRSAFCEKFEAVPGMSPLYQRCTQHQAAFHYVSASPWQFYEPLVEFFAQAGLPAGTFHLRHYRIDETSLATLRFPPDELKAAEIEKLLIAYPARRFILFGDSGQRDPEVYGHIARKYPGQVLGIFIREVQPTDEARFEQAFAGVEGPCHLFKNTDEIDESLRAIVEKSATQNR